MQRCCKKAVLFDFGDTIASTVPPYPVRLAMSLRALGFDVKYDDFERAYVEADYEVYLIYKSRGAISNEDYMRWFFRKLFERFGIQGRKRVVYDAMKKALKQIAFTRTPIPGAVELLESIKKSGLMLGIISNNDGKTELKCRELGILEYFDIIADSTALGLTKPDRRIFEHVLRRLGIKPSQAIHIGDLWGADVMGGLEAGLEVIWFNNRHLAELNGISVPQVADLSQVSNLLNL
jgi:putative hydrolase of the HAD superfamily